MRSLSD
jgi:chromosome segregation ATPase